MAETAFNFIEGQGLKSKFSQNPRVFQSLADRLAEADTLVKVGEAGRDAIQGLLGDKLRKAAEYNDRVIEEAVSGNRSVAIEVDEKLVAFEAYMDWAQPGLPPRTMNGRKIYMMTKGVTLPDFRHRGFNRALTQKVMKMITEADPDAYILSISKEPHVKRQFSGPGWERSTITQLLDRCDSRNCTDEKYDYYKKVEKEEEYEAFLLDPKKF